MDYSAMTLDSFAGSFCSTSRDGVLESAAGWGHLESRDSSDLVNHSDVSPVNPEQIYQRFALLMECRRDAFEFAEMTDSRSNTISRTQMEEQQFLYHDEVVGLPLQSRSQSHLEEHFFCRYDHSSSSRNPPSLLQATAVGAANLPSVGKDEAAIMRAMMAVISSSNSSSSAASSPSAISNPPPQEALTPPTTYRAPAANSSSPPPPSGAFRPYSSTTTPNSEPRETSAARGGGQKMVKESVEMLRRMRSRKGEESSSRSTNNNNQLHHMMSERRRREKLNDSFHRLRTTLPPGSKKDKASVLINATNHLKTLRAQIAELQEKNRRLEAHLLTDEVGEEGSVRVQVMKAAASSEAAACGVLQQIHIVITVRVECNIVDLLLHVLECLKGLRVLSIGAVDAFTNSPQMPAFARANLNLQMRSCDSDEVLLQEAVKKAIDDVTAIPGSISFQFY